MWLMLQQSEPDDYVIATGETHSVREFVETAFQCINRTIKWEGEGSNETGRDAQTGQLLVRVNPKYFRPTEVVNFRYIFTCVAKVLMLLTHLYFKTILVYLLQFFFTLVSHDYSCKYDHIRCCCEETNF